MLSTLRLVKGSSEGKYGRFKYVCKDVSMCIACLYRHMCVYVWVSVHCMFVYVWVSVHYVSVYAYVWVSVQGVLIELLC